MRLALAFVALVAACAKPDPAAPPAPAPPPSMPDAPSQGLIRTHEEAAKALGSVVRVRGRFAPAKLGAMVETDAGLAVICPDLAVGDVRPGTVVTFEGRLELADYSSQVGPGGTHSAGTAPGTKTWVLRDCKPPVL